MVVGCGGGGPLVVHLNKHVVELERIAIALFGAHAWRVLPTGYRVRLVWCHALVVARQCVGRRIRLGRRGCRGGFWGPRHHY